jgi:ribosomal 30S subunit maturation factor RimM
MSMTWNPVTHEDYEQLKGFEVFSSDNEKLGKIDQVMHPATGMPQARGQHYFRVDPGTLKRLFSGDDEVYVPETLVRSVDIQDDKVILEVPKSQVAKTDWRRPANFDTFERY